VGRLDKGARISACALAEARLAKSDGAYEARWRRSLCRGGKLVKLTSADDTSARDVFIYYSGATPSAVRYKDWKMYYSMAENGGAGWFMPLINYHWTVVDNIKRDPFEQSAGFTGNKSLMAMGGAIGSPCCAYLYDWNMLPIGQQLWEEELMSFERFPPLQTPEVYNLSQILVQMRAHKGDD